jgi:hypothetical protein
MEKIIILLGVVILLLVIGVYWKIEEIKKSIPPIEITKYVSNELSNLQKNELAVKYDGRNMVYQITYPPNKQMFSIHTRIDLTQLHDLENKLLSLQGVKWVSIQRYEVAINFALMFDRESTETSVISAICNQGGCG